MIDATLSESFSSLYLWNTRHFEVDDELPPFANTQRMALLRERWMALLVSFDDNMTFCQLISSACPEPERHHKMIACHSFSLVYILSDLPAPCVDNAALYELSTAFCDCS